MRPGAGDQRREARESHAHLVDSVAAVGRVVVVLYWKHEAAAIQDVLSNQSR
jgi:hypothetical protein